MQIFTRFCSLLAIIFTLTVLFAPISANSETITIPEITYSDADGKEHTLDTSKHKLTALHFWATWCNPCVRELPLANEAQKKYSRNGFNIVALSVDDTQNIAIVKKFYIDKQIDSLDLLFAPDISVFRKLKLRGLPTTIFINNEGKVIARTDGAVDWQGEELSDFIEDQIGARHK